MERYSKLGSVLVDGHYIGVAQQHSKNFKTNWILTNCYIKLKSKLNRHVLIVCLKISFVFKCYIPWGWESVCACYEK